MSVKTSTEVGQPLQKGAPSATSHVTYLATVKKTVGLMLRMPESTVDERITKMKKTSLVITQALTPEEDGSTERLKEAAKAVTAKLESLRFRQMGTPANV